MTDYKVGDKRIKYKPGDTFTNSVNTLTYIKEKGKAKDRHKTGIWKCFCPEGIEFECVNSRITNENTKSCGHLYNEMISNKLKDPTTIYLKTLLKKIKDKCYNPKNPDYYLYGGRKIEGEWVYEEWRNNTKTFIDWVLKNLGPKPSNKHSFDRWPDNEKKGYIPGNVRWGTEEEQANNKRDNINIKINGITKTASQWSRECGGNPSAITIIKRFKDKWSEEKLLEPIKKRIKEKTQWELNHPYYGKWSNMMQRCYNSKHPAYKNYGGKKDINGNNIPVIVEEYLQIFSNYEEYINSLPKLSENHTDIDRWPNKEGNYIRGNLRWATRSENCRNKRNNKLIPFNGEMKTLAEVEEKTGIGPKTLLRRLNKGLSEQEVIKPIQKRKIDDENIIKQIRTEKKNGIKNIELCEKYEIGNDTLKDIIYCRGAYQGENIK